MLGLPNIYEHFLTALRQSPALIYCLPSTGSRVIFPQTRPALTEVVRGKMQSLCLLPLLWVAFFAYFQCSVDAKIRVKFCFYKLRTCLQVNLAVKKSLRGKVSVRYSLVSSYASVCSSATSGQLLEKLHCKMHGMVWIKNIAIFVGLFLYWIISGI